MMRPGARVVLVTLLFSAAALGLLASIVVPIVYLLSLDDKELSRWSNIGEAIQSIGVVFSGAAFIVITVTLIFQRVDLNYQREELGITREGQWCSSEIALRQLHNEDHYCNLILISRRWLIETRTAGSPQLTSQN